MRPYRSSPCCSSEGTLSKSDPESLYMSTPHRRQETALGYKLHHSWAVAQLWFAEQLQLLFSFRLSLFSWSIETASSVGQEKCFPECLLSSQAPWRQGLESPGTQRTVISPSCPQPAGDSDLLSAREVLLECTALNWLHTEPLPHVLGPD